MDVAPDNPVGDGENQQEAEGPEGREVVAVEGAEGVLQETEQGEPDSEQTELDSEQRESVSEPGDLGLEQGEPDLEQEESDSVRGEPEPGVEQSLARSTQEENDPAEVDVNLLEAPQGLELAQELSQDKGEPEESVIEEENVLLELEALGEEIHRKSSANKDQIEPGSQTNSNQPRLSLPDEEAKISDLQVNDPSVAKEPKPMPKYQIKEFVESASKLKFEIKNTRTTFNILLPTLKKVVETPEWEKVQLKRELPEIASAMKTARSRTRDFLLELAKRDVRMVTSEGRFISNYEKARVDKERMRLQGRGVVKDVPEPPQRWDPSSKHGHRKRPTEYPPMPTLRVQCGPKDDAAGARLRCARARYNQRSDDKWLRGEQLKLIKAAERLRNSSRLYNERLATPPQRHDPWTPVPKSPKFRPNIPLPMRRS